MPVETLFCNNGFYCSIPVVLRNHEDGFDAWYPYAGQPGPPFHIEFPIQEPETLEEVKLYQKALGEFIALLENPPQYSSKPEADK